MVQRWDGHLLLGFNAHTALGTGLLLQESLCTLAALMEEMTVVTAHRALGKVSLLLIQFSCS